VLWNSLLPTVMTFLIETSKESNWRLLALLMSVISTTSSPGENQAFDKLARISSLPSLKLHDVIRE